MIIKVICFSILFFNPFFNDLLMAELPAQILFPGDYHGNEVPSGSDGMWWAVCGSHGVAHLTVVEVKTESVHDLIVDEDVSQKTGINVTVTGCQDPLLLIRNLEGAKNGKLITGKIMPNHSNQEIECFKKVTTKFSDDIFIIKKEKISQTGYRLILTNKAKKQVIYTTDSSDLEGQGWSVNWVGDLDGDSKPDFLIEASNHYNVSERRLFLSTGATKNELVRFAASFRSVGC